MPYCLSACLCSCGSLPFTQMGTQHRVTYIRIVPQRVLFVNPLSTLCQYYQYLLPCNSKCAPPVGLKPTTYPYVTRSLYSPELWGRILIISVLCYRVNTLSNRRYLITHSTMQGLCLDNNHREQNCIATLSDSLCLAFGAEVCAAVADGDALNRDIDNHHWRK